MHTIISEMYAQLAEATSLFEIEVIILRSMLALGRAVMRDYLEQLDRELHQQISSDHRNKGYVERTIVTVFGPVTFKRHRYKEAGYALDKKLQIEPHKAVSGYLQLLMAKLAAKTTMRNAADTLNELLHCGISVNSVMKAVHSLGPQVAQATKKSEQTVSKRRVPNHLTIEGDAFLLNHKGKRAGHTAVHHFRVYEVEGDKMVRKHDFLGTQLSQVKTRVQDYLDGHYALNGQTIFLGSDAGPGYEPESMKALVPFNAHGEYVVDRYHALQKIAGTLGHQNPLTKKAQDCLRGLNWDSLRAVLDTYESLDLAPEQLDSLQHLRNYLARNWQYVPNPWQRGYHGWTRLGAVESSHRAWTYRMKKQGKSWSKPGLKAMVALVEARMNGTLTPSLKRILIKATRIPVRAQSQATEKSQQKTTVHLRQLFREPVQPSCGVKQGRFVLNAPTSRPFGRLVKSLNH